MQDPDNSKENQVPEAIKAIDYDHAINLINQQVEVVVAEDDENVTYVGKVVVVLSKAFALDVDGDTTSIIYDKIVSIEKI